MTDLLTDPRWLPEHLGAPLPDSPHAVSVCLPTWQYNIGYEERAPRVVDHLQTGYPRFFYNALCRRLFDECRRRFAEPTQECLAFPSRRTAERCAAYLRSRSAEASVSVHPFGTHDVHAVVFDAFLNGHAKDYWQHSGHGITSRHAEACLAEIPARDATHEREVIARRLADIVGVDPDGVFLYPCGMSAVETLHRVLTERTPGRAVQFGFPYVDTLKVLEKFGPGAAFYPHGNQDDLSSLKQTICRESVSGIYTEFPSNPLLDSPDLAALREIAAANGAPLVVDDTVASCFNVDLRSVADVVVMSLTKYFSGVGDVTGGALIVMPGGEHHGAIAAALRQEEGTLWGEDVIVLERNSRDFTERMPVINETARALVESLRAQPEIAEIFYPTLKTPELFDRFRRPQGGYGGLFSIVLKNPQTATEPFFNALRVSKGPNLGMSYTLACPYTILAHYDELDFAESCGVSRYLIRVSVGIEPPNDLQQRFREALDRVGRE